MIESNTEIRVDTAVEAIKLGRPVIVTDDAARENEADLIIAAEAADESSLALLIRYTSGIICVPMQEERLRALRLEPMVASNSDPFRTAFTVSVDYIHGTSTGVSAHDRAITIKALASHESTAADFAKPGHVFPLAYRQGGVLVRAGHTEAALDLVQLAGLKPAGVLAELTNDDGTMMRGAQISEFAKRFEIPVISIDEIIRYRRRREKSVKRIREEGVRTRYGEFHAVQYECVLEGSRPFALIKGALDSEVVPLVRVHSETAYADAVGLYAAPHRAGLLDTALAHISQSDCGVLIYIPHGDNKQHPALLQSPRTRVDASSPKGIPQRWRETGLGSAILADLGASRIRILDDTSKEYFGLEGFGLQVVERVSLDAGSGLPTDS
jgi:3,4-dihydroxy 2-butanone 4-phosphate synthase/GTP cyclohydrolase II